MRPLPDLDRQVRALQPGYDFLIQGIMGLTGDPAGEPQKIGAAWIDILTGLHGVIGVEPKRMGNAHPNWQRTLIELSTARH